MMGTYKVPQNVEAEDKILGPLSLKQFIYAVIGIGYGALMFLMFKSVIVIWIFLGLPPMLFMLALGLYQREDQPLETFVVAVFQFIVRPKQRIWEKEPITEVFRVEPPKVKVEAHQRDPREVRSQLAQLADLVDTRGWSIKEPELQDPEAAPPIDLRDRIGSEILDRNVGQAEVSQADDIMAAQNPGVQNLNSLLETTGRSMREEAIAKMYTPSSAQPAPVAVPVRPVPAPQPAPAAQPTAAASYIPVAAPAPAGSSISATSPALPSDAILRLATEGGDMTVAQIASQAHREQTLKEGQTVSLRNGETTTTTTA